MIVALGILICVTLALSSWILERNLLSPLFLLSSIWSVVYCALISRNDIDLDSPYYLIFAIGTSCFAVGYYSVKTISYHMSSRSSTHLKSPIRRQSSSGKTIRIIFGYGVVVSVFFWLLINFISLQLNSSAVNAWQTLTVAKASGIFIEPMWVSYGRNLAIAFIVIKLARDFSRSNPSSLLKVFNVFLLFVGSFIAITAANRGSLFLLIIAICILYCYQRRISQKAIGFALLVMLSIILFVFILIAFQKFIYQDQSDVFNFITVQFRTYFSSSPPAFVDWISRPPLSSTMGSNTFGFFLQVFNAFGADFYVPPHSQEFVYVGKDITNVYTIYQFYASDFGLGYSLIIQLILGSLFGFLQAFILRNSTLAIRVFSALMFFPLMYMFFDDKFFSLLSTWIQFAIWIKFFTHRFAFGNAISLEEDEVINDVTVSLEKPRTRVFK